MKKINLTILGLLAALTVSTSCSNDYLDINENPNSIHQEDITPKQMLPGAQSEVYRTQAGTMNQFGNLMMNSWAGNVYAFGGPFQREFNLGSVDNTFYQGIWTGLYPRISYFAQIERFPNADGSNSNYIAIAKFMKAFYMQYIVDLYGNAPYSEAFLGQANMTPKYDDDAMIYRDLIKSIEDGIAMVNDAPVTTDIIYQGDMQKWKKFGNTVKLRLLLRMSNLTGADATYRDQKLATLANASFVDTDVIVNPGYNSSNDSSMNPFMLTWGRNSAGSTVQANSLVTVSEHMANSLEGNKILNTPEYAKFTGINDPRRTRMFTAISNAPAANGTTYTGLKGVRQGAVAGQPGAPTGNINVSKIANSVFAGANPFSTAATLVDAANKRGGIVMLKSESLLLQAEAALRYPAIFGSINAQAQFEEAIRAHAVTLGATAASMDPYIASINARPGLGWTGTNEQKIEAIMTQKWIALTNFTPTEMFIEYNRTGYPWTPMATTAQYPRKPYRLIYPVSEYAANSANVPNLSTADVFVKNAYTPFWIK